jgi:hypothetical protein
MTSKERILCALNGTKPDHIPLTTWCFGFRPPEHLTWTRNGNKVKYWYTNRLEHIHSLPFAWSIEDDFNRALAWKSLGIDDILEVSVPWNINSGIKWNDRLIPKGDVGGDSQYPVMVREYQTPLGLLEHSVKHTGEEPAGWPVQPEFVPVFEDYNIPRGVKHMISNASDIDKFAYLYCPPGNEQVRWFNERMSLVRKFSIENGLFVQAWTAFGLDAVVWLMGVEGAIMMSMNEPDSFRKLIDVIAATDYERTLLAVKTEGIDMVCQRGWYSSTAFWSPDILDACLIPHVARLADLAHNHGKKFGFVITTGVELIGPRLADAGVDMLFFIDPVQDGISLEKAKKLFGDRITMVGGINSVSLISRDHKKIYNEVKNAIEVLGPTNRFILHPLDAIFPDTPWEGLEMVINAWKDLQK